MSLGNRLQKRSIPLLFREIVLRVLLASAITDILLGVCDDRYDITVLYDSPLLPLQKIVYPITPLLVILHHVLRLWPRKCWLNICELFASTIEIFLAGVVLAWSVMVILGIKHDERTTINYTFNLPTFLLILQQVSSLMLSACSFISFLILLHDIFAGQGKNILQHYNFSADSRPSQRGRQRDFIFGKYMLRKRFSTDHIVLRSIRAVIAVSCLVALLSLAFIVALYQPLQQSERRGIRIFKLPIFSSASDPYNTWLGNELQNLDTSEQLIKVVLLAPRNVARPFPVMNVNVTVHPWPPTQPKAIICDTGSWNAFTLSYILAASCEIRVIALAAHGLIYEIFATIDFLNPLSDYFQLYLGMADSIDDILTNVKPTAIGAGANLRALSTVSVKERFSSQKAATFGIPKYRQVVVINTHSLATDWSSSLPQNNNTATLRVVIQPQSDIEIERDYIESSVLNGFAQVGGIWTLANGIFAAVFGSTLLLVLFGIKPLSVFGLIHIFQPGRRSLVDRGFVLSPGDRDHIVGILGEHLLDVSDVEDGDSAHNPSPVASQPQPTSYCDVRV